MSSAQTQIINAYSFNTSTDYKYVKPKINKSGGKSVGILNSNTNKALYLSTPLMLTWGVQEFVDEQSGRRSYDMALQFPKEEYESENTKKFLENMISFQSQLKEDCVKYSKEWMNKTKMSPEVVDALFHPMLKYPKDPETGEPDLKRAPTMKIKLDYWDEQFNCEIYDMKQKPLFQPNRENEYNPVELIPKATNVALVLRCGGLWFANGKFGCTWKLVQAVVKPKISMSGQCFIQLTSDEMEKLETQSSDDSSEKENKVNVDDSDDEEDVEKDVAQEVSQAVSQAVAQESTEPVESETKEETSVKKKVVRRKKTEA